MSKLETKLTASIKPDQSRKAEKAASAKVGTPDESPPVSTRTSQISTGDRHELTTDLNNPGHPLHPDRIWPD
ncbi:MAG: hypothetical protein ACYCXG_08480 [Acidiferrobacter sp.]